MMSDPTLQDWSEKTFQDVKCDILPHRHIRQTLLLQISICSGPYIRFSLKSDLILMKERKNGLMNGSSQKNYLKDGRKVSIPMGDTLYVII